MSDDVVREDAPQNTFEDLTLSELLLSMLDAGYTFDQLKRMTMAEIYGRLKESAAEAPPASQAQAA